MELFKHTLFINLDKRKDRLEQATREFEKMNIPAERVTAVESKMGAIGCTLSHIRCLTMAKTRDWDYVFICEDDITFLNPALLLANLDKFHKNTDINWDLLIIGGNNVPPYTQVEDYCARVFYCQTTTGYIVKKHYYDTLLNNFRESVDKLMREPHRAKEFSLDIYWKRLQHQDFWYMITPPTVSQYESYSDIENRQVNYTGLMLDMDKAWLFKNR
jgi:GR25 family glycosyltransferase involved in LPS biosynthesis